MVSCGMLELLFLGIQLQSLPATSYLRGVISVRDFQKACDQSYVVNIATCHSVYQHIFHRLSCCWLQCLDLRVRTNLEDKAKNFSQALANEVLVSHLQDLEDADEDDKDNDKEEQSGTPRHHQGPDDDDDQNDFGVGPSIGGAANEPSNSLGPYSKPPPPAPKGNQPKHKDATRTIKGS
ncbi:hypothetical protein L7F22_056615 [Adiantum nelumboides]|nr:hypothetical protein [Adiantum nelumboides]